MLAGRLFNIKKKIQNFKETSDLNYIYKNELGKACFAHDMRMLIVKIQLR